MAVWLQHGCMMAASAKLVCCLSLLSLFHYSLLCKQVWDGAHPFWDAFAGLCVYITTNSKFVHSIARKGSRTVVTILVTPSLQKNPRIVPTFLQHASSAIDKYSDHRTSALARTTQGHARTCSRQTNVGARIPPLPPWGGERNTRCGRGNLRGSGSPWIGGP